MKIEVVTHKDVAPDGKLPVGGAVETAPFIGKSLRNGTEGYWVNISTGRNEAGEVTVIRAEFENAAEMAEFLKGERIIGTIE